MKKILWLALVLAPFLSRAQAHTKEGVLPSGKDSTFNVLLEYSLSGVVYHAIGRAVVKGPVVHWFIRRTHSPKDTVYVPLTVVPLWYSRIDNISKWPNY
jgi:hypothetical protein